MTRRLREALLYITEKAEALPESAQDELAARLEHIVSDMTWERLLADPTLAAAVDKLADEALADFTAGQTKPLRAVFGDDTL